MTTLHVTHDQGEALALGHRVAVLRDGRVEQVGTPDEVWERPASAWVARFVGTPPMNLAARGGPCGERGAWRGSAPRTRVVPRRRGRRAACSSSPSARARSACGTCARASDADRGARAARASSRRGAGRAVARARCRRARVRRFDAATGRALRVSERRQVALMLAPVPAGRAAAVRRCPPRYSLALALTDADLLTPSRFVGLDNFRSSPTTRSSPACSGARRCSSLIAVPLRLAVATGLALLLHARAAAPAPAARPRSCRASCPTRPGRWSGCSCSTRSTGR